MISRARRTLRFSVMALPALFLAGTALAGHELEREDHKTIDVKAQTSIVINNTRGKTIIVGESGSKAVEIHIRKKVIAASAEKAQRIMDALELEIVNLDDEIILISKLPKSFRKDRGVWSVLTGGSHGAWMDLTVEVPKEFAVHASTTSGDVHVSSVAGSTSVNATSGNVLLREIGGTVVVELTSGNIQADGVDGDLWINATSGGAEVEHVKGTVTMQATSGTIRAHKVGGNAVVNLVTGNMSLDGCLGDVDFTTSSGDAEIIDIMGDINAASSSGKLDVVIVPVGEKQFYLNTSSGDVVLRYVAAEDYGFLLDVNTCNGSIKGDLAIDVNKITRRMLKGIVGTGKSRVIIETASGDVSIVERKDKVK